MTVQTVTVSLDGQLPIEMHLGDDGWWTASVTAPGSTSGSATSGQGPGVGAGAVGKGYYSLAVTATDDAGNTATAAAEDTPALRLKVEEKVKPVASFTSPGPGSHLSSIQPQIAFQVKDLGSGVDASTLMLKVDDTEAVHVDAMLDSTGGTATGTWTPSTGLAEGQHTIELWGQDHDGNTSDHATLTMVIDTTPPEISVTSPVDGSAVNTSEVTVAGTTNDARSSPCTVSIVLSGATTGSFAPSVQSDGAFYQIVTLGEGETVITVTATDAVGKTASSAVTVTLNLSPPVIQEIEVTPVPVGTGDSLIIRVRVTDA